MSEHLWVGENLETHVAEGLKSDERNRIERHLSGCHDCARELADLRAFDQAVTDLFAAVRPAPGLESRMIETLRPARRVRRPWLRFVAGMAATILLGLLGYGIQQFGLAENLRLPGAVAEKELKQPDSLSKVDLGNSKHIADFAESRPIKQGAGVDERDGKEFYPPALGLI